MRSLYRGLIRQLGTLTCYAAIPLAIIGVAKADQYKHFLMAVFTDVGFVEQQPVWGPCWGCVEVVGADGVRQWQHVGAAQAAAENYRRTDHPPLDKARRPIKHRVIGDDG